MKYKLPIVTAFLIALTVICLPTIRVHWARAQGGFPERSSDSSRVREDVGGSRTGDNRSRVREDVVVEGQTNRAGQGSPSGASNGQALVRDAVTQLLKSRRISADVRQRIRLFGQELFGVGSYQQMVVGDATFLRLEMNVSTSKEQTERLLQISDGMSLWTRRTGAKTNSLEVVNLTRVQQVIEYDRATAAKFGPSWMMLGGLPKLVRTLSDCYQFGSPIGKRISKVPVWQLMGQWKPDVLKRLRGKRADKPLPEHLPATIRLTLGRGGPLPLFPYRVEFGRMTSGQGGPSGQGGEGYQAFTAMVTLEFYRVQSDAQIDPEIFKFLPGEQSVIDRTDAVLDSLKP